MQETAADGTVTATYTYDDKGAPVKVVKGSNTYYFQYNGQGDVIALTDATGTVAATYKYDDWGNLVSQTGNIDVPFGYRGQYGYIYDKETGLYFLKSRYYDPETGRFTTKDRFKGFENRPASQNPYTYCENDPVNKVDPEGKCHQWNATFTYYSYENYRQRVEYPWGNRWELVDNISANTLGIKIPGSNWNPIVYRSWRRPVYVSIIYDIYLVTVRQRRVISKRFIGQGGFTPGFFWEYKSEYFGRFRLGR